VRWGRRGATNQAPLQPVRSDGSRRPGALDALDEATVQTREVGTQAELAAAVADGLHPVLRGTEQFLVGEGSFVTALDNAKVYAVDDAWVRASDRAAVSLFDEAAAYGDGQASVSLAGSARAVVTDHSRAWLGDRTFLDGSVRAAVLPSVVATAAAVVTVLTGSVEASGDTHVYVKGGTVRATERAYVHMSGDPGGRVEAHDDVIVWLGSGSLVAHDRTVVELHDLSRYADVDRPPPSLAVTAAGVHVLRLADVGITGECRVFEASTLTPLEWAELFRLPVVDGSVTLFTALLPDWGVPNTLPHVLLRPGSHPVTLPPVLRLWPRPALDLTVNRHLVGCRIRLDDIWLGSSPTHRVTAAQAVSPGVWEVDMLGRPI
jgi:hypothetical protein